MVNNEKLSLPNYFTTIHYYVYSHCGDSGLSYQYSENTI